MMATDEYDEIIEAMKDLVRRSRELAREHNKISGEYNHLRERLETLRTWEIERGHRPNRPSSIGSHGTLIEIADSRADGPPADSTKKQFMR